MPFESVDQGEMRRLTHWEQLDGGEQFTAGKKFVIGFTILLYVKPHPHTISLYATNMVKTTPIYNGTSK